MILQLSEHSAQTLQEQIRDQLRACILSGELGAEDALPSIRALARQLRVSVITVQRAYDTLLGEQLIYARRGKGFFVAALPDSDKTALARDRFRERLQQLITEARRDGLDHKQIEATFQELAGWEE